MAAHGQLEALAHPQQFHSRGIDFGFHSDFLLTADGGRRTKLRAPVGLLTAAAEDDVAEAQRMKRWIEIEPAIGFQSEMQVYSFSKRLIDNKIRQVRRMLATGPMA